MYRLRAQADGRTVEGSCVASDALPSYSATARKLVCAVYIDESVCIHPSRSIIYRERSYTGRGL